MVLTATELRKNLYNILDQVLESGVPVEINRKGKIIKIVPDQPKGLFESLEEHDITIGNPDDLVHIDWSDHWNGDIK